MNEFNCCLTVLLCIAVIGKCEAQSVTGHFPFLADTDIHLYGYSGFGNYKIAEASSDTDGHFKLDYSKDDLGMGYISDEAGTAYIVVLSGKDVVLKGNSFADPGSIACTYGFEQQAFIDYAEEHPRREQALGAWDYLERIYRSDSLFSRQTDVRTLILSEKSRIHKEDTDFIKGLPTDWYVSWYLPLRKLLSSVPAVAQYRTAEIANTIEAFRNLNYADPRLYKSGILKDAIDSHYWLIENSGMSIDSVVLEMNTSTDAVLSSLLDDEQKFNEIGSYLFELLERRSLSKAAEYLAIKVLNHSSCTLVEAFAKQLEIYRAMKKGNTAPDISFSFELIRKGQLMKEPAKLSDVEANHKLVVFGASWCQKCLEDIPRIARHYSKWQEFGIEVIFISLEDDRKSFHQFVRNFPFLSYCDYLKWESPAAEEYHVFATPTMFLLDQSNKIILRPNSVQQVDAWVDWFVIGERY